jgi:hypothetical protein
MTESFERLRTSVVSSPITLIADSCRAYSADRNQFPVVAHFLFLVQGSEPRFSNKAVKLLYLLLSLTLIYYLKPSKHLVSVRISTFLASAALPALNGVAMPDAHNFRASRRLSACYMHEAVEAVEAVKVVEAVEVMEAVAAIAAIARASRAA